MNKKITKNCQDKFLDSLQQKKIKVAIYLTSGIKLEGYISSYDQFSISLENEATALIYKRAICSILPA